MRCDPGARRQRKAAGQAVHLAESAFDALVQEPVRFRQLRLDGTGRIPPGAQYRKRLEILDVAVRIVIEYDTGIQQSFRIEKGLDPLHDSERAVAPFVPDEGGHIPSRPVFRLQRTVVFPDHQFRDILDHVGIALHLRGRIEGLVDDEMEIPFQRMAVDARIGVAVPLQQVGQVRGGGGQVFDVEGDVLDEAGCSLPAHTAHRRKNTGPDGPEPGIFLRILREAHFFAGDRVGQDVKAVQDIRNGKDASLQFRGRSGCGLGEKGCEIRIGISRQHRVVHGEQGPFVQQFRGMDDLQADVLLERDDGFRGCPDRTEIDHGAGLVRGERKGFHRDFAQESECSF